jgi:mycoredoxin
MTATTDEPAGAPARITVYGTRSCGDCHLATAVLEAEGASYQWIDLDRDPKAAETVLAINGGYRSVPTILFPDGRVLVEPSRRDLTAHLRGLFPLVDDPQSGGHDS